MNRKERPLSNCERDFLLRAVQEGKRIDGREVYDYRSLQLSLGKEAGHVEARLGGTRVLARVSCEVVSPLPQRPTDGQLFFNVELSPMASPAFESGRPSVQTTEVGRILERCFRESRAVDTESLCIVAGEKVWSVRVDLHVLDDCGNIIDCAALAAITALKHFKRPDVTVIGEEATIHTITERDPVPLSVHHMPLCVTFAFFWDGEYLLVDPSHQEERVMDGRLVVAMNVHREICALQMAGGVAILPEQIQRCAQIAVVKCNELTEVIKRALSGTKTSEQDFTTIYQSSRPKEELPVTLVEESMEEGEEGEGQEEREPPSLTILGKGTVELGMGGQSLWEEAEEEEEEEEEKEEEKEKEEEEELKVKVRRESNRKKRKKAKKLQAERESSSEEELTMVITELDTAGSVEESLCRTTTETAETETVVSSTLDLTGSEGVEAHISEVRGGTSAGSKKKKRKGRGGGGKVEREGEGGGDEGGGGLGGEGGGGEGEDGGGGGEARRGEDGGGEDGGGGEKGKRRGRRGRGGGERPRQGREKGEEEGGDGGGKGGKQQRQQGQREQGGAEGGRRRSTRSQGQASSQNGQTANSRGKRSN